MNLLEKLLTCWAYFLFDNHWEFSSQTHFPVIIAVIEAMCELNVRKKWKPKAIEQAAVSASVKASTKTPGVFSLINVVHTIIMCIAPFLCIFSLTYSCTHSPDFMFYDCALTCYTTTMMTMMYSHCIHRGT